MGNNLECLAALVIGRRNAHMLVAVEPLPPDARSQGSSEEERPQTRRFTEGRPRHAGWRFGSHGGAAFGELNVDAKETP